MEIRDDIVLPRRLWGELVQWRAGYHCESCSKSRDSLEDEGLSGRLHAHHKDGDRKNNRLSNGECLCPPCHGRHHRKLSPTQPCEPGCTCKRHLPSWNRIQPGQLCINGHDNWMETQSGMRCRTCTNERARKRYHENPDQRRKQLERSLNRVRKLRVLDGGGGDDLRR